MNFARKFLLLLTVTLMPWFAWGQIAVNGKFMKDANRYRLVTNDERRAYVLMPSSRVVAEQLARLESGDMIRGTATIQSSGAVLLQTLDFVGLHRMLGEWQSTGHRIAFRTFSEIDFYTQQASNVPVNGTYRYALSPGQGDQWKIFISDEKQVTLATLNIVKVTPTNATSQAILTFYDARGAVTRSLPLFKSRY